MENLIELNSNELLTIDGGDRFLHDLGQSLGIILGGIVNIATAYSEGTTINYY